MGTFSQLPNVFGRQFLVGFVVPVLLLLGGSLGIIRIMAPPTWWPVVESFLDQGIVWLVIEIWLAAVVLELSNTFLFRLFEGYHPTPFRPIQRRKQRREFERRRRNIEHYQSMVDQGNTDARGALNRERREFAQQFPDEHLLLATAFGNIIRAAESYPRTMYGFEATQGGWERLLAVMPEAFLKHVDNARSALDCWINLRVVVFAFGVVGFVAWAASQQAGTCLTTCGFDLVALAAVLVALFAVATRAMINAGRDWSELLAASMDLYLPKLAVSLGFDVPSDHDAVRAMWRDFTRARFHHDIKAMPPRRPPSHGEGDDDKPPTT